MESTQSKVMEAGRRAQEFLDAYAAKVAAFVSALVRKQLDAGVAAIADHRGSRKFEITDCDLKVAGRPPAFVDGVH